MSRIDMSARACVQLHGHALPKSTLFNALLDVERHPDRSDAVIEAGGHRYTGEDIDELLRSPEFAAYREELKRRGKVRD